MCPMAADTGQPGGGAATLVPCGAVAGLDPAAPVCARARVRRARRGRRQGRAVRSEGHPEIFCRESKWSQLSGLRISGPSDKALGRAGGSSPSWRCCWRFL